MFMETIDKKTGQVVGLWHQSLGGGVKEGSLMRDKKLMLPPLLEEGSYEFYFPDPSDNNVYDPSTFTPSPIFEERIIFEVRLFRCDTGQSLYFQFNKMKFDAHEDEDEDEDEITNRGYISSKKIYPVIQTEEDFQTLAFCSYKDIGSICLDLVYEIDPVVQVPPPNNNNNNNNNNNSSQQQQGSDEDWRKIRHRLQIHSLEFGKVGISGRNKSKFHFHDVDNLLLSLEALPWK